MPDTVHSSAPAAARRFRRRLLAAYVLCVVFCAGCSSSHYRKAADKESYNIIQQAQKEIFGHTNAFTIDTPYSSRDPKLITPSELVDDRLRTNQRVLTIEGALELAATSSRRYQAEKEKLFLFALTLTGARYDLGPKFFGSSSGSLARESNGERSGAANFSAGVSRTFRTGGTLGLNIANDLFQYYTGNPRRSVISSVSANLSQPLLRGFGKNSPAVETLTQSERDVVYAVRNFAYFQDQFALEIVNDYFNLLAQKDVIRNRYTNFLSRVQATVRLDRRSKDRERLLDVDQARQAELTARINYVNALASYKNSLDQFKIKLGLSLGEAIHVEDRPLEEAAKNGLVDAQLDVQAAYKLAVARHTQILNAIDKYEDLQRKVRVFKDRLKPGLTVSGDVSLDSDGPTDYTKFDPNKVRAGAGVKLDLPFDRLKERNSYRSALISFEAELRNLTLTLDSLHDDIERGLRTLEQRRQNYEIQKVALDLANRRVRSTALLQQAGRAEVRDLVDAQDSQIAAQNAVTSALVSHQEARLQLMLDIGALKTDAPKFWLRDHLTDFAQGSTSAGGSAAAALVAPRAESEQVVPPDTFFQR